MKRQSMWLLISLLIPLGSQAAVFQASDLMAKIQASGSDSATLLQELWLVPSAKNSNGQQMMLVNDVSVGSECEKAGVKKGDYVAMGTPQSSPLPSIKTMEIHDKPKSSASKNQELLLRVFAFDASFLLLLSNNNTIKFIVVAAQSSPLFFVASFGMKLERIVLGDRQKK